VVCIWTSLSDLALYTSSIGWACRVGLLLVTPRCDVSYKARDRSKAYLTLSSYLLRRTSFQPIDPHKLALGCSWRIISNRTQPFTRSAALLLLFRSPLISCFIVLKATGLVERVPLEPEINNHPTVGDGESPQWRLMPVANAQMVCPPNLWSDVSNCLTSTAHSLVLGHLLLTPSVRRVSLTSTKTPP
jgi:hypothetical protein